MLATKLIISCLATMVAMSSTTSALPLPAYLAPRATFDLGQQAPLRFTAPATATTPRLHIVEDDSTVEGDNEFQQDVAVNEDSIFNEFIPVQEQADHVLNPEVAVEDDHTKTFSIGEKRIGALIVVKQTVRQPLVKRSSSVHASKRTKRSLMVIAPKNKTKRSSRKAKKSKKSTVPVSAPSVAVESAPVERQPTRSSSVAQVGPTQAPSDRAAKLSQLRFIGYENIAHETLAAFL
ncbi:hypothetical protein OIV83_004017 [Microbotryomycetes sp. JL201]|nr:hypothetical protein OIV83_004017 [Microbotryomycetes sp. JL201]